MASLSIPQICLIALGIIVAVGVAALISWRLIQSNALADSVALAEERKAHAATKAELLELRETFALCVMELARPAAYVQSKADSLRKGQSAIAEFRQWALYLVEKVGIVSQLFSSHTSGSIELASIVDIRRVIMQAVELVGDDVDVNQLIMSTVPVQIIANPRDLLQAMTLLLHHAATCGASKTLFLQLDKTHDSAHLTLWTDESLKPRNKCVMTPSLESRLSVTVIKRQGATIVSGGPGEPLFSIAFPLAERNEDRITVEGSQPIFRFTNGFAAATPGFEDFSDSDQVIQ